MREPAITCPKGEWRPTAESRWPWFPGCGLVWKTVDGGGVCPGCTHQWEEPQCLTCLQREM